MDEPTRAPAPAPAVPDVDGVVGIVVALLLIAMLLPAIISGVFGILWWLGVLGRRHRRVGLVLGPLLCGFAVLVLAGAAAITGVITLVLLLLLVAAICFSCTIPWVRRFLGALAKHVKAASREAAKPAG